MKIFVAGATGTIGRRLVPLLVRAGHDVTGMTRSPRWSTLGVQGASAVAGDVYDRDRLFELLASVRPEVVIDELSDLGPQLGPRAGDRSAADRRIRTEGARNLVDAAIAAGARRVVAQSHVRAYAPTSGWVKRENDPLDLDADAPPARRLDAEAVWRLEHLVLETPGIEGVALRYGSLYGPGTPFAATGTLAEEFRQRRYPVIGDGKGMTSFAHVDDAVRATVLALTAPVGVYNICDDRPATEAEWVPFYAGLIGAPPPRHVLALASLAFGREQPAFRATRQRGASNAKARVTLRWEPEYPAWREGFRAEARRERAERARAVRRLREHAFAA